MAKQSARLAEYIIMQEARYHSRLKEFRNDIRRKQIEQMKRQFRMGAELDLMNVNELAGSMGLPTGEYSVAEVVALRAEELERPPLGVRMQEEEGALPIDAHIRFWRFYSEQLELDPALWTPQVAALLMAVVANFTYQEVHFNVVYELHLLNTLQLAAGFLPWPDRQRLLDWVAGPEGLRVIEACLGKSFLKCSQYPRVYRVVELGLKSELRQENEDAAAVLSKILQAADWDDSFEVYKEYYGLAVYLCGKIERYCKEGSTRAFTDALLLMLDTYDEALKDYTRTGAGYSAALLVAATAEASQLEGLTILRVLTQADEEFVIEELLKSKDVRACGLWERLFGSRVFSRSNNTRIREVYFSLLENLLAHAKLHQIEYIAQYFNGDYEDLYELLAECLRDEDNTLIIRCALSGLKSLAYYGQREGEDNALLPVLEAREILKHMERLAGDEGIVGELAIELLAAFRNH